MILNIKNKITSLRNTKFVQDVAILQTGSIIGTLLSIISSVIFARILGASLYGTYSLVFAFVALMGIFMDWGVGYGSLILLAEAYSKKDKNKIKDIIIYFLKIFVISTVLLGFVIMFVMPLIADLIYNEPHIGYLARWIVLASMCRIFYSLMVVIFQVTRKMKYLTILENVNKSFYTLIPILFVIIGGGVFGIVFGHFITAILFLIFSIITYIVLTKRNPIFPSILEICKDFFKVKTRKYFWFGFTMAVDRNIGRLNALLPITIAGVFMPTDEIAFFKIAVGLAAMSSVILSPVSRLLNVQLPQSKTQSYTHLKKAFYKSTLGSFLISIFIAIVLIIVSKPLVLLFYGEEFISSVKLIYFLSIHVAISGLGVGLGAMYRTLNKMKTTIKINTILTIVGLPLFYLLIKNFGIWGLLATYIVWKGAANIIAYIVIVKIINKLDNKIYVNGN